MQWFILDRSLTVLCVASTDSPDALFIDDTNGGQKIELTYGCAIGSYEFEIDPRDPRAIFITEGNYIAFRDRYDRTRLFTIIKIEGSDRWTVFCEDIGLDLLNDTLPEWDESENDRTISYFLDMIVEDTGWSYTIDDGPIKTKTLRLKASSGKATILERLKETILAYEAEADFEVEMVGTTVTKRMIHVMEHIGNQNAVARYTSDLNLISLDRRGSIENLITAILPTGNKVEDKDITLTDFEHDDGRYVSIKGDPHIYDLEARDQWTRYREMKYSSLPKTTGYITKSEKYDADTVQDLFDLALKDLQDHNHVEVSYEAEVYDVNVDIGDMVQLVDTSNAQKVYLTARVQSVTNHYTVPGNDTCVFANYVIMKPSIAATLQDRMDYIEKTQVSIADSYPEYVISTSPTEPPGDDAGWSRDVPSPIQGTYLWTRTTTVYTNGSSSYSYSVTRYGIDGTLITATYYLACSASSNVTPSSIFVDPDTQETYTWTTSTQVPTSKRPWLWTYNMQSNSGIVTASTPYIIGHYGTDGVDGKDGTKILSVVTYYAISNDKTQAPEIPADLSKSKWSDQLTVMTVTEPYLWSFDRTTYLEEGIQSVEDSTPAIIGVYGNTGRGVKLIVTQYLQAADSETNISPDDSRWGVSIPDYVKGYKIWMRDYITWDDGKNTATDAVLATTLNSVNNVSANAIVRTKVQYAKTRSNVMAPSSNDWKDTAPTWENGYYIWTRTIGIDGTGAEGVPTDPVCISGNHGTDGSNGKGIVSIVEQYLVSTSATDPIGDDSVWSTDQPTWTAGHYIWTRSHIVWTEGEPTNTPPILAASINSANEMAYNASTAVGDLTIGGRNLTLNSSSLTVDRTSDTYNYLTITKDNISNNPALLDNSSYGVSTLNTTDKFTVSFDYLITGITTAVDMSVCLKSGTSRATYSSSGFELVHLEVGTNSGHYTNTTKLSSNQAAYGSSWMLSRFGVGLNQGAHVVITNFKFEKGSTATDWTPAPEDTDNAIALTVKSADVEYYLSTSSVTPTGSTWKTTADPWVDGKYMWSRTKVTYQNDTTTYYPGENGTCISGAQGPKGDIGVGITKITPQYYLSTSNSRVTGGQWSDEQPEWEAGKYIWTRSKLEYSDDRSPVYTDAVLARSMQQAAELANGAYNEATNALRTAEGKARVFTGTTNPTLPYSVGDVWMQGATGDIMYCITAKGLTDSFSLDDWATSSDYMTNTSFQEKENGIYANIDSTYLPLSGLEEGSILDQYITNKATSIAAESTGLLVDVTQRVTQLEGLSINDLIQNESGDPSWEQIKNAVTNNSTTVAEITSTFSFDVDGLKISRKEDGATSLFTTVIGNKDIDFKYGSNTQATIGAEGLIIREATVQGSLSISDFAFVPRRNGSLDFKKVRKKVGD